MSFGAWQVPRIACEGLSSRRREAVSFAGLTGAAHVPTYRCIFSLFLNNRSRTGIGLLDLRYARMRRQQDTFSIRSDYMMSHFHSERIERVDLPLLWKIL